MGEGFIGFLFKPNDARTERKIVLSLFIIGLLLMFAPAAAAVAGLPALASGLFLILWVAMILIVLFSVLRHTGRLNRLGLFDWVKGA